MPKTETWHREKAGEHQRNSLGKGARVPWNRKRGLSVTGWLVFLLPAWLFNLRAQGPLTKSSFLK